MDIDEQGPNEAQMPAEAQAVQAEAQELVDEHLQGYAAAAHGEAKGFRALNGSAYVKAQAQAKAGAWLIVDVQGTTHLFPFDVKNIVFGDRRAGHGGRYYMDRLYHLVIPELQINMHVPLRLQAAPLQLKWDFKPFVFELSEADKKAGKKAQTSYSMEFDISSFSRTREQVADDFVRVLEAITDQTVDYLYANRGQLFARSAEWTRDRVKESYQARTFNVCKTDKKTGEFKEYEPSLNCKVKCSSGVLQCFCYDEHGAPVEMNQTNLPKGRKAVPIIEDGGIMFYQGQAKDCQSVAQALVLDDGVMRTNAFQACNMYVQPTQPAASGGMGLGAGGGFSA